MLGEVEKIIYRDLGEGEWRGRNKPTSRFLLELLTTVSAAVYNKSEPVQYVLEKSRPIRVYLIASLCRHGLSQRRGWAAGPLTRPTGVFRL